MKITKAQKDALDVVMKLMDSNDPNKKEYILTLICGILNLESEDDTSIITINPNNGNDRIQLNIPDWRKTMPTPPDAPHYPPFPPQAWYEHKPEPIQTDASDDVRYASEVTCTGDKNGIIRVTNTTDM